MRNWLKTVLFVSAFSPVLLSLAFVRWQLGAPNGEVVQLVVVGLLGSLLPLLIINSTRQSEAMPIAIKKLEANDFALFAFFASYCLPIVLKAAEVDVSLIFGALVIAAVALWGIHQIPAHPILHVLQYRFYKAESESGMVYVLIARRSVLDPKSIKLVRRISSSFLIECH